MPPPFVGAALLLGAGGRHEALLAELGRHGVAAEVAAPGRLWTPSVPARPCAFLRQVLPEAMELRAPSISAWAEQLSLHLDLPDGAPWRLHVYAESEVEAPFRSGARAAHTARRRDGGPARSGSSPGPTAAWSHRAALIREALLGVLKARRRHLLRALSDTEAAWTDSESLVQLLLVAPDQGYLSITRAPAPAQIAAWLSVLPAGIAVPAEDPRPPSRAYTKLIEAERRFGRRISPGDVGVDLGASPGGWSFVALQRGAQVIAVDRSPLVPELMAHPGLQFVKGDAFSWRPPREVDWLWCDVIAAPERTLALLVDWLQAGWARHFVVTLKLRGEMDLPVLDQVVERLGGLAAPWWMCQLSANKGEVCLFGSRRLAPAASRSAEPGEGHVGPL